MSSNVGAHLVQGDVRIRNERSPPYQARAASTRATRRSDRAGDVGQKRATPGSASWRARSTRSTLLSATDPRVTAQRLASPVRLDGKPPGFTRRRFRVRCRSDLSRRRESAACSPCTSRLSRPRHDPTGIESAPSLPLPCDTDERKTDEGRAEQASRGSISLRTLSPHATPLFQ